MSRQKKRRFLLIITIMLFVVKAAAIFPSNVYAVRCINILRMTVPRNYTNPKNCIKCHDSIYRSWKKSRHARSWTSSTFIKASEDRSKQKCFPCHIPRDLTVGSKPDPRVDFRQDGIYCIPCHMTRKEMNSPPDIYSPPDPTHNERSFQISLFCGSCHKKTYEEWLATGVIKKCQTCHMRSERKPSDHGFGFLRLRPNDIRFSAKLVNKDIIVNIMNRTIPHNFPTAENGDPRVFIYVKQFDKTGEEVDKSREFFSPQLETGIPYGKKMTFEYEWSDDAVRAEITLQYKPAWTDKKKILRRINL